MDSGRKLVYDVWGLGEREDPCLHGGPAGLPTPGKVAGMEASLPLRLSEYWPLSASSDTRWPSQARRRLGRVLVTHGSSDSAPVSRGGEANSICPGGICKIPRRGV